MVMKRTMSISEFKARCLALVDEINETGETLVLTKRGTPVAEVVPAAEPASLAGTVRFLVSDDELIAPLDERWDADMPPPHDR
jgi:prevent-host-death family protein